MAKQQPTTRDWGEVKVCDGQLVGVLTDELAKSVFPASGKASITKLQTVKIPKGKRKIPR